MKNNSRLYNPSLNINLGVQYIDRHYNIQVLSLNLEDTYLAICTKKALSCC